MQEPRLEPCLPLPIMSQKSLEELIDKAKDWAVMHGAAMRSKTNFSKDSLNFAPFTLLPSAFPRDQFERAVKLQPLINKLVHRVAHDHQFLEETLKNTIKVDDFTGRLYKVHETVRKEGYAQPVSLGLLRSDYLSQSLQGRQFPVKQVEVNTIASSFGGIATQVSRGHRFILQEIRRLSKKGYPDMLKNLPENNALQGLCAGMLEAWQLFANKDAVILFVVEDVTYNICDQRFHEYQLQELSPEVRVVRRSLTQLADSATLSADKHLLLEDVGGGGSVTVAVVYFRAGYEPSHYMSEREWATRLLIEQSTAVKCPSIHYHLAGTKKVQQALARPGCLEKFLQDTSEVEAVRSIFTGLYSLDFDEEGEEGVRKALAAPHNYVLKPQREGGGNNVYGDEITTVLTAMRHSQERTAWILMDRIVPPVQHNYIIRPMDAHCGAAPQDVVCELGIFGVIIGDAERVLVNRQVGHMLRSKLSSADEGGVAAGVGALDSPFLTP